MGEAVGSMLASAVGIAISPPALVAVVLMLAAPRRRTIGLAFAAAGRPAWRRWWRSWWRRAEHWVRVAAGRTGRTGWRLALGVLFVLMTWKRWRDRPRAGHVTAPPRWMREVGRFSAGRSAGLAVALVTTGPKNLALAVGGAASIAASTAGIGGTVVAAALMVLIGSLCTLLPLGVHLLRGDRSARTLGEWKAWLATHSTAITTTVLAVIGAEYVGDAITGLA